MWDGDPRDPWPHNSYCRFDIRLTLGRWAWQHGFPPPDLLIWVSSGWTSLTVQQEWKQENISFCIVGGWEELQTVETEDHSKEVIPILTYQNTDKSVPSSGIRSYFMTREISAAERIFCWVWGVRWENLFMQQMHDVHRYYNSGCFFFETYVSDYCRISKSPIADDSSSVGMVCLRKWSHRQCRL
jgi:hypothetical protein